MLKKQFFCTRTLSSEPVMPGVLIVEAFGQEAPQWQLVSIKKHMKIN